MIDFPHSALDLNIVLFFNKFCGISSSLDAFFLVLLSVDAIRTGILIAFIIGIWEFGRVKKDKSANKRVIMILLAIVLTLGIIEGLNAVIDSPRPIVTNPTEINEPLIERRSVKELWRGSWVRNTKHGSFPSDTVALLATMATGLFLWNRMLGVVAFIFVFIGGILPRMYFGLHYPSDMIVGTLISVFGTLGLEKFKPAHKLSEMLVKLGDKYPYFFGVAGFYIAYIIADKFILLRKLPIWIRAIF